MQVSVIVITQILGVTAFVAMGFCMLALNDIFHGEVDVRQERWVVRITFIIWLLFIAATFFMVRQIRRNKLHEA